MLEEDTSSTVGKLARLSAIQGGMRQAFKRPFTMASSIYSRTASLHISPTQLQPGSTPKIDLDGFDGCKDPSPRSPRLHIPPSSCLFAQHDSSGPKQTQWTQQITEPVTACSPVVAMPVCASKTVLSAMTGVSHPVERPNPMEKHHRERQRRHKHHGHHQQQKAWIGSHRAGIPHSRSGSTRSALNCDSRNSQNIYTTTIVGALFLLMATIAYTVTALFVPGLGNYIHVLFISTLVLAFIFLVYSIIHLRQARRSIVIRRARIKAQAMTFNKSPDDVHTMRDEELGGDAANNGNRPSTVVKIPPPAYGLWRSSIKIQPEMVFCHKPDRQQTVIPAGNVLRSDGAAREGPPPPSYISEEEVSCFDDIEPTNPNMRDDSTSALHPAYRL